MAESISTDNITVSTILAATELAKVTTLPDKRPETVGAAFKTIFQAIIEARQGK